MADEQLTKEEKKSLRVEIFEKLTTLMVTAFGLVAALAWNDAVQTLFKEIFGEQSNLAAKFIYASGITVVIVALTIQAGRVTERLKSVIAPKKDSSKN
jgi:hypothetical protein